MNALTDILPDWAKERIWAEKLPDDKKKMRRFPSMKTKNEMRIQTSVRVTAEYIKTLEKDVKRLRSLSMKRAGGSEYEKLSLSVDSEVDEDVPVVPSDVKIEESEV